MASLASPLNVAVGAEARREGYKLFAGEPDSYRYGGQTLANGTPAAAGRPGVPGLPPGQRESTPTAPPSAPSSTWKRT